MRSSCSRNREEEWCDTRGKVERTLSFSRVSAPRAYSRSRAPLKLAFYLLEQASFIFHFVQFLYMKTLWYLKTIRDFNCLSTIHKTCDHTLPSPCIETQGKTKGVTLNKILDKMSLNMTLIKEEELSCSIFNMFFLSRLVLPQTPPLRCGIYELERTN